MRILFNEKGKQINADSSIYMGEVSINVCNSFSLYIYATDLSLILASRTYDEELKVVSSYANNEVVLSDNVNITGIVSGSGMLYSMHFVQKSTTEKKSSQRITIHNGPDIVYDLLVHVTFVDVDDRLVVLLNNFNRSINDKWYNAFESTNIEEYFKDENFLNEKRRLFLLEFFELTGLIGSYRAALNAIKYFGYDELVYLREYWKSIIDDTYKTSDVTYNFNDVEALSEGYRKTRMLSLVYELNYHDGTFDDDGLPNYVKTTTAWDALYFKLLLLKQILQETFLPDDVKIIDIVGQYTSVAGYDLITWLHQATYQTYSSSEYTSAKIVTDGIYENKAYLTERKLIVDSNIYTVVGDVISVEPAGSTAHFDQKYFSILRLEDELENLNDFELLTKYFSGDVSVITARGEFGDVQDITRIRYLLLKKTGNAYAKVLTTPYFYGSSVITLPYHIGIRDIGDFMILLEATDIYGTVINAEKEFSISLEEISLDFKLAKPKYENQDLSEEYLVRDIKMDTTSEIYETIGTDIELLVPDANSNSIPAFDINDRTTATRGYRSYRNDIEKVKLNESILAFGGITINRLNQVPISEYDNYHESTVLDILNGANAAISLKLFAGHEWETVSLQNTSSTEELLDFVSELNRRSQSTTSAFRFFTWSLQRMHTTGDYTNYKNVILCVSKKYAFGLSDMFLNVTEGANSYTSEYGKFNEKCSYNKILIYHKLPSAVRISTIVNSTDTLRLKLGTIELSLPNTSLTTLTSLRDAILSLTDQLDMFLMNDSLVVFNNTGDLEIEHDSIGFHCDIMRQGPLEKMYRTQIGSPFQIGSCIFAYVDDDVKIENADIEWKLYNTFSSDLVLSSKNKVFRYLALQEGIFDLEINVTDMVTKQKISKRKKGAIKIE